MTSPADTPRPSTTTSPPTRTARRIVLNTGALAGSSLWRIAISFVLQVMIARFLGAEGLGQYATALAWLNVCQVLSELGLPQLLVRDLARAPHRRGQAFATALPLQIGAGLLIWGGVYAVTSLLPYQPETRLGLVVICASLPLFAVTSTCETLFQAGERMELVMGVEVFINTLIVGASLVGLWLGGSVVLLCGVLVATQAVSALLCLWLVRREKLLAGMANETAPGPAPFGIAALWRSARPFYGLALANVLLHRLDILLLSVFAGEAITGIYSAAYLIVRVLIVLAQTWWQALYPTLSRLRTSSEEHYRRLAALAIRFGLTAFLPAAALSHGAAAWLLGIVYQGADESASLAAYQLLIWAAPLFLIASYAVNLLLIERQPQGSLLIAGTHIVVAATLLPFLTLRWQAVGAAGAMVGAISASGVVGLLLLKRLGVPAGLPSRLPFLLLATGAAGLLQAGLSRILPWPGFWPGPALLALCLYLALLWRGGVISREDFSLFQNALRR